MLSTVINKNSDALTMMLETDVDSNEYEVATSNDWPQEGYIFNSEMSACERGEKLSWDSENNRVVMASGSADKCYVYFDRYTAVRITNVIASDITNNSITLTVEATAEGNPISTYYFSSDDGVSYEESTNNTYTFNNLETGTEYNFRVYAVDTNGISSNVYTLSESTLSTVYLADYIKNTVYTGDGNEGIYYHDGIGSYTNAAQEAGDNSYRYSGADPANYVCFGSDDATCPADNLYRIISITDGRVKLIKSTNYMNYIWDSQGNGYNSNWGLSEIYTLLNTDYYNQLGSWNTLIYDGNIDGSSYTYIGSTSGVWELFTYGNTQLIGPIGMISLIDYGYAANPELWKLLSNYDDIVDSNWLYLGVNEWTLSISIGGGGASGVFYITSVGNVGIGSYLSEYAVRPKFFLNSNVLYLSGDGSQNSPFRISM